MRRALVLGGAACVWDDAKAALLLCPDFDFVVAVKMIGEQWPGRITHWVSLHPEKFKASQDVRARAGFNQDYLACTWDGGKDRGARIDVRTADWRGASGLLGVKVAIEAGADRIVLAGIPMTATPHFYNTKPWRFAPTYQTSWTQRLKAIQANTRSMSGWTRTLLGAPDLAWLGIQTQESIVVQTSQGLVFEAREDFPHTDSHGRVSHYAKGLRYVAHSDELRANVAKWVGENKVAIVAETGVAEAKASGTGTVK